MNAVNLQAGEALLAHRGALAQSLVAREFSRHPELEERYGAVGRAKSLQDALFHLDFLAAAVSLDSPKLFGDYIGWAKVVLARRGVRVADFGFHLECTAEAIADCLPGAESAIARAFVATAILALPGMPDDVASFIDDPSDERGLAHQYLQALLRADRQLASSLILAAVDRGTSIESIYLEVFQPTQREVGRLWQLARITVAQEHYCTAATQLIMAQLYGRLFSGASACRSIVVACVGGDLHEIGARMVADLCELAGWTTFYTGASTPTGDLIDALVERKADVLALSATMATHVGEVRSLVTAIRAHPGCAGVRILVGGYPFNVDADLWRKVGADGFAPDARGAVSAAEAT